MARCWWLLLQRRQWLQMATERIRKRIAGNPLFLEISRHLQELSKILSSGSFRLSLANPQDTLCRYWSFTDLLLSRTVPSRVAFQVPPLCHLTCEVQREMANLETFAALCCLWRCVTDKSIHPRAPKYDTMICRGCHCTAGDPVDMKTTYT